MESAAALPSFEQDGLLGAKMVLNPVRSGCPSVQRRPNRPFNVRPGANLVPIVTARQSLGTLRTFGTEAVYCLWFSLPVDENTTPLSLLVLCAVRSLNPTVLDVPSVSALKRLYFGIEPNGPRRSARLKRHTAPI